MPKYKLNGWVGVWGSRRCRKIWAKPRICMHRLAAYELSLGNTLGASGHADFDSRWVSEWGYLEILYIILSNWAWGMKRKHMYVNKLSICVNVSWLKLKEVKGDVILECDVV